jgi:hypothetical protein
MIKEGANGRQFNNQNLIGEVETQILAKVVSK